MTNADLKKLAKRFGKKRIRTWFLDGPGQLESQISRREWCATHGSFHGYKSYCAEFEAEKIISELPRLPAWLVVVPVVRCAREAAR